MTGSKAHHAPGLTARQEKWFASVRASLESSTGRTLGEWVAVARTCPETGPKKRVAWLKAEHGLGLNYASYVLDEAFPADAPGWDDPAGLRVRLWAHPASLAVLEALERVVADTEAVVTGQRKTYTAWSRTVQFAAARPLKGGRVLLGLKLEPGASARLNPPTRTESWSERLTAVVELGGPEAVDAEVKRLFRTAAERG